VKILEIQVTRFGISKRVSSENSKRVLAFKSRKHCNYLGEDTNEEIFEDELIGFDPENESDQGSDDEHLDQTEVPSIMAPNLLSYIFV